MYGMYAFQQRCPFLRELEKNVPPVESNVEAYDPRQQVICLNECYTSVPFGQSTSQLTDV